MYPSGSYPVSDVVMLENVYPASIGQSLGTVASASSAAPAQPASETAKRNSDIEAVAGPQNPMMFWIVFVGLLILLMVVAKRWGEPGEFSNLRASAYNVLFIALVAITGIPIFKLLAVKIPGPWSSYILSI